MWVLKGKVKVFNLLFKLKYLQEFFLFGKFFLITKTKNLFQPPQCIPAKQLPNGDAYAMENFGYDLNIFTRTGYYRGQYYQLRTFHMVFLSSFIGHYQANVLQSQMVIAGYYIIIDVSFHNSFISCGKSNRAQLISTNCFWFPGCVHVMKRPSSEEWCIAIGPWFSVDEFCESIVTWVFISMCLTATSWSSLEFVNSIDKSMCKQTLVT
jgi:hypothetical protein